MNPMTHGVATIAISTIYIIWNHYRLFLIRRDHLIRQRVAYMLWMAAMQDDEDE